MTNANQYVTLSGDAVAAIGADTKALALNIYNPTQENMTFRVTARLAGSSYGISVINETLLPGWNRVEIPDISQMTGGALQSLSLYFTDLAANYAEKTVVFGTMTVYGF